MTWFRNPYARLILVCLITYLPCQCCNICCSLISVSCHINDAMHHSQALQELQHFGLTQVSGEDADDYKRTLRAQLKALIEREKDPLGPTEWVVCYIKPAASDPLSKGPRKVRTPTHQLSLSCMCIYSNDKSCSHSLTPHYSQPTYVMVATVLDPSMKATIAASSSHHHASIALQPTCAFSCMYAIRCSFLGNPPLHDPECSTDALPDMHSRCLMLCAMTSIHEGGSGVCGWTSLCSRGRAPLLAWRTWSSSSKLLSNPALRPGLQPMKKRCESCMQCQPQQLGTCIVKMTGVVCRYCMA